MKGSLPHLSLDSSEQRGGSYGGGPGLGHNKDIGVAAGLRNRVVQTSPAGSGCAVHQEQHITAVDGIETPAQGSNWAEASPEQRLIRIQTTCLRVS